MDMTVLNALQGAHLQCAFCKGAERIDNHWRSSGQPLNGIPRPPNPLHLLAIRWLNRLTQFSRCGSRDDPLLAFAERDVGMMSTASLQPYTYTDHIIYIWCGLYRMLKPNCSCGLQALYRILMPFYDTILTVAIISLDSIMLHIGSVLGQLKVGTPSRLV